MFRKPVVSLLMGHPFELLVATWALVSGLPLAIGLAPPSPALSNLNSVLVTAFGLMLSLGGMCVMVGLYVFFVTHSYVHQIIGMRVEQCGWVAVSSGVVTLLLGILITGTATSYVGVITFTAISLACGARYASLNTVVRSYGKALKGDNENL